MSTDEFESLEIERYSEDHLHYKKLTALAPTDCEEAVVITVGTKDRTDTAEVWSDSDEIEMILNIRQARLLATFILSATCTT